MWDSVKFAYAAVQIVWKLKCQIQIRGYKWDFFFSPDNKTLLIYDIQGENIYKSSETPKSLGIESIFFWRNIFDRLQ